MADLGLGFGFLDSDLYLTQYSIIKELAWVLGRVGDFFSCTSLKLILDRYLLYDVNIIDNLFGKMGVVVNCHFSV